MVARNWNRVTAKDVEDYNRLYGKELGYLGPKVAKGLRFIAAFEGFVPREEKKKGYSILGFSNYKNSTFESPGYAYARKKGLDKRDLTIADAIALWKVHMDAGWGKENVDRLEELDEQSLIPAMDVGWHGPPKLTKRAIEEALAGDKIVRGFPVDLVDKHLGVIHSRNNARREIRAGTPMEELEKREARYVALPPSHKRAVRKVTPKHQDYTQYVQDEAPEVQASRLKGFKELEDLMAEYATLAEEEQAKSDAHLEDMWSSAKKVRPLGDSPTYAQVEQFIGQRT